MIVPNALLPQLQGSGVERQCAEGDLLLGGLSVGVGTLTLSVAG